jgi:transglycosylase-like protein with SLT domain
MLRHAPRIATAVALILFPSVGLAADTVNAATSHPGGSRQAESAPGRILAALSSRALSSPVPAAVPSSAPAQPETVAPGTPPRQLLVPDLAAVVPGGASQAQVAAISRLPGVRAVLALAGGQVSIGGRAVNVLGVPLPAFRSWAPPVTAAATGVWVALADSNMVADSSAAARLGFSLGGTYQVQGAAALAVPVTVTAPLGIPGIDAVVNSQVAGRLGLASSTVVLVNAPGANYSALISKIRSILGPGDSVTSLVPVVQADSLPVNGAATTGSPTTWLQLYQDSAAEYCPGLSWTVLAAIGEIESGDGSNEGPSTAGALGPMQFMPGTWAMWGTDGFGETGSPDIMNPLDAVPSAARLLCAAGAASGSAGLSAAIYDYNHATWYVSEVLGLAGEYAREYH